jgi:catechol-2,3-dioxygenase
MHTTHPHCHALGELHVQVEKAAEIHPFYQTVGFTISYHKNYKTEIPSNFLTINAHLECHST